MSHSVRKKKSAVVAIAIATLALLFFWSALIVVTFRIPQTGVTANPVSTGWQVVRVQPGGTGARAGLHNGDVVVYSTLRPDCSKLWYKCHPFRLFSGKPVPRFQLAAPVTLSVVRHSRKFYVTLNPGDGSRPYPFSDFLTFFIRLIVYTAMVALGCWLVLLRPGIMTWAFFVTCVSLAAPTGLAALTFVEVLQHGAPLDTFWNISMAVQLGLIALPIFLLRFPDDISDGWRGPTLTFALWTFPWVFPLAFLLDAYNYLAALKLPVLLVSFVILVAMYAGDRGTVRKRLQWAIVGITAAIVAAFMTASLGYLPATESSARSLGMSILDEALTRNTVVNAATFLYAIMTVCMTYAIVKHRVIDVRFIVNRGIVIGIMLVLFGVVFSVLDWIFTAYVFQSQWQIAIGMAVAFTFGCAIRSLREQCIDFVDRAFFRKHHAGVAQLRALRLALDLENAPRNVWEILTKDAATALRLTSAALFERASDGGFIRLSAVGWASGTAWHLLATDSIVESVSACRAKPFRVDDKIWTGTSVPGNLARPALAVPLTSRRRVVALAIYGAHVNGTEIDPDEVRLLGDLCAAAAPNFAVREAAGILATPALGAE